MVIKYFYIVLLDSVVENGCIQKMLNAIEEKE